MFRTVDQTGIKTTTITFTTWEEELQSYHKKFKEKTSLYLFVVFRDYLEKWASYKEDGFLKNFLIEGSKLTQQAKDGDISLETLLFYIETLQIIVSKK